MPSLLREGLLDLSRRLKFAWLWTVRLRLRAKLFKAEGELGWLGWEQADFYDETIAAQVAKVQEFENTQALLLNTSAELSGRKAELDEELAKEKALHDQTLKALTEERMPIGQKLEEAETRRRLKLEAVERFGKALEEIARTEKMLEVKSLDFMKVQNPNLATRIEARQVSDELGRLPTERNLVMADKSAASEEAGRMEPEIARLRGELQRIDTAVSAARDRLETAMRKTDAEARKLERERKKSSDHMSKLDRQKREPYRAIGACLADHGIAPLNQPEMLERVLALRGGVAGVTERLGEIGEACASTDKGLLAGFYILFSAVVVAVCAAGYLLVHH